MCLYISKKHHKSKQDLEQVHGTIGVGRMINDVVKKVK